MVERGLYNIARESERYMNKVYYWSQDVCKMLNLSDSTLRRWCIMMKKKGYVFETDENGRRRFKQTDINAIRSIQQLSERPDTTIEQAIESIITGTNMDSITYPVRNDEQPIHSVQLIESVVKRLGEMDDKTEKGLLAVAQEIGDLRKVVEEQKELIDRLLTDQTAATREPGWIARFLRKFF